GLGIAIVQVEAGLGVVTDGDIRRALEQHGQQVFVQTAENLVSLNPASVPPETRVEDALALMEQRQITRLLVITDGELLGVFKK
ncbi:MAG: CBS domain-containing protein, partial [Gammaproteobacteria bacterium]|nr:CBS domain-containing protein [Gammaproteobacteria bacterium]